MRALKIMFFLALMQPLIAQANIVAFPTRIIFDSESVAQTVTLKNNGKRVFLASATFNGNGSEHFAITPPLVRIDAGDKTQLRIRATDTLSLPLDRESVFYYVVTMIAGDDRPDPQTSRVAVATRYWFKLFYRPTGIGRPASNSCDLIFTIKNSGLYAVNNTPFYTTLFSLAINGQRIELAPDAAMIAPHASQLVSHVDKVSQVEWARINDFGGSEKKCLFSFTDNK